ncbi:MAG: hypothetical protein WCS75_11210 [Sphingomonas sp.]
MLSMTLAGCARHAGEIRAEVPKPVAVVVKDTPPAELLRCPESTEGFPQADAVMARPTRAAIIRLAKAYAGLRSQLERLIDWNAPKHCSGKPE